MFAALATNAEFFSKRINLFCALAPVTRVDEAKSETLQAAVKDNTALMALVDNMPFEIMAEANASNALKGGLVQMLSIGAT